MADWYASRYETNILVNPPGPTGGTLRVARGGSFTSASSELRAVARTAYAPETRGLDTGFRTVGIIPEPMALWALLLAAGVLLRHTRAAK